MPKPEKDWILLIYLAGDNNLSEEMIGSLEGMFRAAASNTNIRIFACFDSIYPTVKTAYYDFSKPADPSKTLFKQIKKYENEEKSSEQINTGKGIARFVEWATAQATASNYALILSGHGDAFRGQTLLFDERPPGGLRVPDVGELIKKCASYLPAWTRRKVDGKFYKQFSILGFDNCAMNLLEVGYEFRFNARYLISSEGFIPQTGWNYEKPIKYLLQNSLPNNPVAPDRLAKQFAEDFSRSQFPYSASGRSIDISVCDLGEARKVAIELDKLAVELLKVFIPPKQVDFTDLKVKTLIRLLSYTRWRAQSFFYEQTVDVFDFCSILISECNELISILNTSLPGVSALKTTLVKVRDQAQRVYSCEQAFVRIAEFTGPDFQFSRGCSVYFPWSRIGYLTSAMEYERLKVFKKRSGQPGILSNWSLFLDRYSSISMRFPPNVNFSKRTPSDLFGSKTGSPWRTGSPWKSEMDILKGYFSRYKNNWLKWSVRKTDPTGESPEDVF